MIFSRWRGGDVIIDRRVGLFRFPAPRMDLGWCQPRAKARETREHTDQVRGCSSFGPVANPPLTLAKTASPN